MIGMIILMSDMSSRGEKRVNENSKQEQLDR